jgi:Ca2+-binding RTX toxin-like protein
VSDPDDLSPTAAGACDPVGPLTIYPSIGRVSDGEDYIEGNAGNDIAFGGLGQDDLVGGNSDFFSLVTAEQRPDGSDLLFGGTGEHTDRSDNGGIEPGTTIPGERHVRDSDTIVGDNGQIIRIVGINGCDGLTGEFAGGGGCTPNGQNYVSYVYDDVYGAEIVVRGVALLDYTPGGPDFRPDRFNLGTDGPCSTSAPATQDGCSDLLEVLPGRNHWDSTDDDGPWREIAGNDEIHGGLGDDFIYLGGGNDVAYGDADDDDIIGGWGNDWISGGVGSDGILGDDGRIFTSRNSDLGWTAGSDTRLPTDCTGDGTEDCFSEPLYGITAFQPQGTCTENKSVKCGDFLDQYISTPGQVQTAVINIDGDLKKTVDLTPFNVDPIAERPLFDANNSDDVIFGGLGGEELPNYPDAMGHRNNEDPPFGEERGFQGDFLHGGAGDDAIAGGEAIWNAYTQVYDPSDPSSDPDTGLLPNAYRSDWSRPYNPGDLLHFGEDDDAWHSNGPITNRLGEFALYDEYDPRRTLELNPDGTVNKAGDGLMWFLNLYSDEGPTLSGCTEYLPNGTCVEGAWQERHSDGGDAMFGDLGNDWMVGGTGQDTMYGGWGNDLLNADDVMTIAADGSFGTGMDRKIQPSPNDTPDTHKLYQDRAYGGAGLDILIGNTGGDRLIDWVGEYNSYIVPFAPFGIATVSRQVPPWLYEFLYRLSENQGADPTRDEDQNATDHDLEARNGEPHGEIGLITQKDHGLWQDQTGGPSDPQPGNIPGGRRDVLRSADFGDGTMATFVPDTGAWTVSGGVLEVAAASLGHDAAAVWYHDAYLPVYYEIEARVSLLKPTGGWKANAYVVFDYWGPDDFKFAGLDDAENKLVMGYKDATGWHIVAQSAIPGGVKYNRWYDLLVAVNGTNVTVLLNGSDYFTYTFTPRVIDDVSYGLNKGLLGFGSDNSRGKFDNIQLQILPPTLTLDRTEDFSDAIDDVTWSTTGSWNVVTEQYLGAAGALDSATARAGLGKALAYDSYLEFEALAMSADQAGLVFDYYGDDDFKFLLADVIANTVTLGHRTPAGWTIDQTAGLLLDPAIAHHLKINIKGASVTVVVDGQTLFTYGYNSPLVDGEFGLLTTGSSTFDDVRVKTNDPGFDEYDPDGSLVSIGDAFVTEGDGGTTEVTLTVELDVAATEQVTVDWVTGPGTALGDVDFVVSSGTVAFAPGEVSKTVNVEVIGDALVEGDETFTVSLSNATGGATVDDGLAVVTIIDDDAPPPADPVVTLTATDSGGAEAGSDPVVFEVTRDLTSGTLAVAVGFGGNAAGSDYTISTVGGAYSDGTVTFSDGAAAVTITLTPVDDSEDETDETVTLTLIAGSGYTVGTPSSASGTIADNDDGPPPPPPPGPALTIHDTSFVERDKGKTWVDVQVTLSEPATTAVTVDWSTAGTGSATPGQDYETASGTLYIDAGQTSASIRVRILSDKKVEGDETFQIVLSNPSGATIADDTAVFTIIDDSGGLRVSAMPADVMVVSPVTVVGVTGLMGVAKTVWSLSGLQVSGEISIAVADLPGDLLARVIGETIVFDMDAAGWGWFVDPTPLDSSEFSTVRAGRLVAAGDSEAVGRIDLLSVLVHEIGHILGIGHNHHRVMVGTLSAGRRMLFDGHRFGVRFRAD